MDVLITGGAGFIGSNLARALLDKGYGVRVLDNLSTGRQENIADIADKIEFIRGDLRDSKTVGEAVDGCEVVLHQGALPSVARSLKDPITSSDININGTINILEASVKANVRRVVSASSSSVYGDTPTLPKIEDIPEAPLSPYATSKLAGEHYCRVYSLIHGLETLSLRYFNVFGPMQNPDSEYAAVVPKFITALMGRRTPGIYGDGEQTRDFTFVGNIIDANVCAMNAKKTAGEAINIGCGERISVNRLLQMMKSALGVEIEPKYLEPRPGDVRDSLADISKAKKLIGYEPSIKLEDGLERTIEWFQRRTR